MGRAVRTKGHSQRRLGRTIRKLEASVELSSAESKAKLSEKRYKEKVQTPQSEDSPVENLRDAFHRKKTDPAP
ncbi:MAG: hypothetical protein NWF05_08580 [Candidatus Bathyarchaeota archaeon]|nr:hypothetical protein [Candidatus Bathyarchaeota archaeon]